MTFLTSLKCNLKLLFGTKFREDYLFLLFYLKVSFDENYLYFLYLNLFYCYLSCYLVAV